MIQNKAEAMNKPADSNVMPGWMRTWEQFWFTPADPSILGLIRIGCGLIVVYTLIAYGFSLDDFMGEDAWLNLKARMEFVRERPVNAGPFAIEVLPEPRTEFEAKYLIDYKGEALWHVAAAALSCR